MGGSQPLRAAGDGVVGCPTVETKSFSSLSLLLGGHSMGTANVHGLRWLWHEDRTGGMEVPVAVLEQVVKAESQVDERVEGGFIILTCQFSVGLCVQTLVKCSF